MDTSIEKSFGDESINDGLGADNQQVSDSSKGKTGNSYRCKLIFDLDQKHHIS